MNSIKEKNFAMISIDAEKAFDRVQHFLMTKALKKLRIEGTYFNIAKAILNKLKVIVV
jgi:hypothetical protein